MNLFEVEIWLMKQEVELKDKGISFCLTKNDYEVKSISVDLECSKFSDCINVWGNNLLDYNLIENETLKHYVKYYEGVSYEKFCRVFRELILKMRDEVS